MNESFRLRVLLLYYDFAFEFFVVDSHLQDEDIEMTIPSDSTTVPDAPATIESEPIVQFEDDQAPAETVEIEDEVDAILSEQPVELAEVGSPAVDLVGQSVLEGDQSNNSTDAPAETTPVKSSSNDAMAESDSLKSPPRKSARLSAKRRLSASIDSPSSRSESPLPRRRSTRRNSNTLTESPKLDSLCVTLSRIDETQLSDESTSAEPTTNAEAAKSDKNDDIDELASAFIEEFVEDFID